MHLNFLDLYLDLSLSKSTVTSEPENYFVRIFVQPYRSGVRCNQVTQPRQRTGHYWHLSCRIHFSSTMQ